MSRTPETHTNKTAAFFRGLFIVAGGLSWLMALGAFQNPGHSGMGLLLLLGGVAAFWVAAKIKVQWKKTGEVGTYR